MVASVRVSLLFMAERRSYVWRDHVVFVSGHLGCFHFGTVVNHAAADMHVQVLCGHVFVSSGHTP